MSSVLRKIEKEIVSSKGAPDFLDVLLGDYKSEALNGEDVVLFGAGSLGQELCVALNNHGVFPVCFCDTNQAKNGTNICGLPVIDIEELCNTHGNSLIVIATKHHSQEVKYLLLKNGFSNDRILCKEPDRKTYMAFVYANFITQSYIKDILVKHNHASMFSKLMADEIMLNNAYNIFSDLKSKELFITKLALLASGGNFNIFDKFISSFSEPFQGFGFDNDIAYPEDYYYFNNDVLPLAQHEIYVDVGAFDGDTIRTFVQACDKNGISYSHILAFEPDPQCYEALLNNTFSYPNVSCHQIGLWSETGTLQFKSSGIALHDQAAAICHTGDVEIQVVSLDDFSQGTEVTFIKMDPGGNVIPDAIRGAARTIAKHRPKLAVGVYHAIESIYEIPLLVKDICSDYRLYLRHNTYHLCDTDLYAVV